MLRYLDTTALADQLDMTLAALRHSEETDRGPSARSTSSARLILDKARAVVAPNLNTDMRRDSAHAVRRRRARAHRPAAHPARAVQAAGAMPTS